MGGWNMLRHSNVNEPNMYGRVPLTLHIPDRKVPALWCLYQIGPLVYGISSLSLMATFFYLLEHR
jgi:hypothetical protein